jgi:hypothetical protein
MVFQFFPESTYCKTDGSGVPTSNHAAITKQSNHCTKEIEDFRPTLDITRVSSYNSAQSKGALEKGLLCFFSFHAENPRREE